MVRPNENIRGFYAVIDRDDESLARQLLASARVLQVRVKTGSRESVAALAHRARGWTRAAGALLIVNDHPDIAREVGADGVHLGQTDAPLGEVRESSPGLLIGVSTHSEAQVRAAVTAGADYLGYGPVFATATKENPDPIVGLAGLGAAVRAAGNVPVVAIGGLTAERAVAVAGTGAAAACVISAVNGAADPESAARAVAAAFAG